ncbi:trypsin-like peptidase domain-containing protein [Streptomyces sp. HMX112]|uniref:trypsin-like peptidase domain-containing protein n=1 Tax=Streptomyces sp. HMX112 TaxID=3390850 RepID=UPI003A80C226
MERGEPATLVRICDPAGRTRGTGFVADDDGTVVTGHEVVDGLVRVVLHAPGGRTAVAGADAITPLPESALALVRARGLGVPPLPLAGRAAVEPGTYVRLAAPGWREARVLGTARVTYTATDRFHPLGDVLELAMGTDGSEALRRGAEAAGGPVLDAATGAVLAVLGTALHGDHRAAGFAVPLAPVAALDPGGPLAALLTRAAATVPAYGPDLNLAGALELTATATAGATAAGATAAGAAVAGPGTGHRAAGDGPDGDPVPPPVERPGVTGELDRFTRSGAPILALVGDPGTGRSTELAALAARRARGPAPAPTVLLRGADLLARDTSLAEALTRALRHAGRILAGSGSRAGSPTGGPAAPERVARLAREAGRPLLVLLDGPEEMPPGLAHRLPEWTARTVDWLRAHGVRLVVACRPEHWERAASLYGTPRQVRTGELTAQEAERARQRYGLPADAVAEADARHPLTLRLLAEVRRALPGEVPGRPGRDEVFTAHLDLMCLRVAVRIAAACRPPAGGTEVRRLAVRVAGRVHEAARRCLGRGQGALDRQAFEELFPRATGWAQAVLAEGLLVPAGPGYRFAHEELADWAQAVHLDLDEALTSLVHRGLAPLPEGGQDAPPVPRHRIGPVVHALLRAHRVHGPAALARHLTGLIGALDTAGSRAPDRAGRVDAAGWWAGRLVGRTMLGLPDARPYLAVLRLLAARIAARPGLDAHGEFGPDFWQRLRIGEDDRIDLLRRLVAADGPPGAPAAPGYLDAVAARLAADPRGVQPLLCRWFGDERPLPARPGAWARPTVAGAAQALLYACRGPATDDLCEALAATAHPRADELLAALARDEPAALCRAVDRWAHDEARPGRRVAAAAYGRLLAERVTADADRAALRYAALALLARPADADLHGPALALLVRDPQTRSHHLERAVAVFLAGDPGLPANALAAALHTHPEPVLAAFRARLRAPGTPADAAGVLDALAEARSPGPARRAAVLVHEYAERHPEGAEYAAAFVDRRLEQGPGARAVLFPLVTGLLRGRPPQVRGALAAVLAAPGSPASRPLRAELLDVLLEYEEHGRYGRYDERDLVVPDALLRAAALGCGWRPRDRTRELVHRAGLLMLRTPEGATRFEQRLVELAREVPGFAALVAGWLAESPRERAPVVGAGTRRAVERLGGPMPMRAGSPGHGSLRPA